jgi:hypothetical protein
MIRRLTIAVTLCLTFGAGMIVPASGAPFPESSPLPVDFAPEGIATGPASTFYAGSLTSGDIYRGNLRTGAGGIFIDAPPGRGAVGMKVDQAHRLLFVAGGFTGQAYAYDTTTGATVAVYQFGAPGASLLNDVIVTRAGAFFTDSFSARLYLIPFEPGGNLGAGRTLPITGPASAVDPTFPNLNGIEATADGSTLIVNHTGLGKLFTIDPRTGASAELAVEGLTPRTLDGLLLVGRTLYAVENFANRIAVVKLSADLTSGVITSTITSSAFRVPTTVAAFGNRLAVVNGRFDLGAPQPFGPGAPPGTDFDVVIVYAH